VHPKPLSSSLNANKKPLLERGGYGLKLNEMNGKHTAQPGKIKAPMDKTCLQKNSARLLTRALHD
jgi:hypothetical protein